MYILHDLFESSYREPPFQTIEEKIQRLGLSDERVEELKTTPVEEYDGSINFDDLERMADRVINLNQLVGYTTHRPSSWYEALDSSVCHKIASFEKYDAETFPQYMAKGDHVRAIREMRNGKQEDIFRKLNQKLNPCRVLPLLWNYR